MSKALEAAAREDIRIEGRDPDDASDHDIARAKKNVIRIIRAFAQNISEEAVRAWVFAGTTGPQSTVKSIREWGVDVENVKHCIRAAIEKDLE